MPRNIQRNREEVGSSKKTSPKVTDSVVQKALNEVYKELNVLRQAVNKGSIGSQSTPSEGKSGDIRLYSKKGIDGRTAHYIQAKFGENWASGRLGVDSIDPELADLKQTIAPNLSGDGGEYITKLGVTFENLDSNGDIGLLSTQVPKGDHTHSHTTLTDVGTHLHSQIDSHINDASIHFTVAGIATTATVSNTAIAGNASTAAPTDHVHKLNTEVPYTWSKTQTFNPTTGNAITTSGNVYIGGDTSIDGNLTVDFAATGDENGNATIGNNATVGNDLTVDGDTELKENVELNSNVGVGYNYTDSYSTTVRGKINAFNEVVIQHQLGVGDNQLSIQHDSSNKLDISVPSTGFAKITVPNNSLQIDAVSVRPYANLTTDLGHLDKKWQTIYAGELFVENLVAQDVMATSGGRIMVAPTSTLAVNISNTTTDILIKHNIFETGDIAFMQSAPSGFAQTEALRITSAPTATLIVNTSETVSLVAANQVAIDYFAGAEVNFKCTFLTGDNGSETAHNLEHGDYVVVTHNNNGANDQWGGANSTTSSYQVFWSDDSSLGAHANTANNCYFHLQSGAELTPAASLFTMTSGPYYYTVARAVDGTPANAWPKDSAVVNWGHNEGDGFIDITSTQGVYAELGPSISLKSRKVVAIGNSTDWLVPEVARIGNLDGTGYTGTKKFGLMVGENLQNSPEAGTDPFKGLMAGSEGVKVFNANIESREGSSLQAFLGKDPRSTATYDDKVAFLLGNGIGVNGSNEIINTSLSYKWDATANDYILRLDGAIDIVGNAFYDSPQDVFDNLPILSTSQSPSNGLYLTPNYLGFYQGSEWPLVIGSSGTNDGGVNPGTGLNPFARIGLTNDTKGYLQYDVDNGLVISGKITVLNPESYAVNFLKTYSNLSTSGQYNTFITRHAESNYNTGIHYYHFLLKSANGGVTAGFSTNFNNELAPPGNTATYTDFTVAGSGPVTADNEEKWFTYSVNLSSATNQNGWRIIQHVSNDVVEIKAVIVTSGSPGDPQAILNAYEANQLAGNHSETIYQPTQPAGSNYNIGDQWVNTSTGNELWIWNGTAWEASFTQIDGGSITTGTIKGVAVESTSIFTNSANTVFPRVSLDMGNTNKLKQYSSGINPERYTELDGGTLRYVHEHTSGGGVENSTEAQKLVYEVPRAMQIIRAIDFNLGSLNTFADLGLTNMYSDDYQVIPIPKTTIVTGQQTLTDINNTNGIAREQVHYDVSLKTETGFKMKAELLRGDDVPLAGNGNFTSDDDADSLDGSNGNNTNNGHPVGGPFPQSAAPQPGNLYYNNSYDIASGEYTFAEGSVNPNTIGGPNKFLYKFKIKYHELLWSNTFDFGGTSMTTYPGYPGTTTFYFMLRVGDGTGSPFQNNSMFHTVTPIGYQGDIETDDLKVQVINNGVWLNDANNPVYLTSSGNDQYSGEPYYAVSREAVVTVSWNSPNNVLVTNPRIELICFRTQRENEGYTTFNGQNYGYHSPHVNDANDGIERLDVKHGQTPAFIEEITGVDYVGALVADGLNISGQET